MRFYHKGQKVFHNETQRFIVYNRSDSSILLENFVAVVFFIVSIFVKSP